MSEITGPVGLTGAYAPGDLIMAKPDWHGRWQPCYVDWATRYQVCCKPPSLLELNVADHLLFGVLSEGEVGNA